MQFTKQNWGLDYTHSIISIVVNLKIFHKTWQYSFLLPLFIFIKKQFYYISLTLDLSSSKTLLDIKIITQSESIH